MYICPQPFTFFGPWIFPITVLLRNKTANTHTIGDKLFGYKMLWEDITYLRREEDEN